MEDLLCPACRDKIKRRLAQQGESNRKQLVYSQATAIRDKVTLLVDSLTGGIFD